MLSATKTEAVQAVCLLPSITVSIDAWREIRMADALSALTPEEVNCVLTKTLRPGNVLVGGSWARQTIAEDGTILLTDMADAASREWALHHPGSCWEMVEFAREVIRIIIRTQADGLPEND